MNNHSGSRAARFSPSNTENNFKCPLLTALEYHIMSNIYCLACFLSKSIFRGVTISGQRVSARCRYSKSLHIDLSMLNNYMYPWHDFRSEAHFSLLEIQGSSESLTKIRVGANFQPTLVRGVHPAPRAIGRPVSGDCVLFKNSRLSIYYSEGW